MTVLAPHYQTSLLTADPEQKANIIYLSKWIFTTIELKSITYHMQVLQRTPLQSYLVTTNTLYFNFTFLEYKWFCPTTGGILWIRLTDGLREAGKGATGPPLRYPPYWTVELSMDAWAQGSVPSFERYTVIYLVGPSGKANVTGGDWCVMVHKTYV